MAGVQALSHKYVSGGSSGKQQIEKRRQPPGILAMDLKAQVSAGAPGPSMISATPVMKLAHKHRGSGNLLSFHAYA